MGRRGVRFRFPDLITRFELRVWAEARTKTLIAEGNFDDDLPDLETAVKKWPELSSCHKYAAIKKFGDLMEKLGPFEGAVRILEARITELHQRPAWSYPQYEDAIKL
jgi:hypothetical protein